MPRSAINPTPIPTPIPTTVIGGFLGAGKTTLVNHLLAQAQGRRIAVLVNDFGTIAIDADLIVSTDGAVMSLANGCVCCAIGDDLMRALSLVLDRPDRPDHLIIEASGVGDPDRIADIARAEPDLHLNAILTIADADAILDHKTDSRIARDIIHQLKVADLIMLNKADLVDDLEPVKAWLTTLVAPTPVLIADHARVPVDILLGPIDPIRTTARIRPHHNHGSTYASWAGQVAGRPSRLALAAMLARVPASVLRLKGFVALDDGTCVSVQIAGKRRDMRPHKSATDANPPLTLTAIGLAQGFDPQVLDHIFASAGDIDAADQLTATNEPKKVPRRNWSE